MKRLPSGVLTKVQEKTGISIQKLSDYAATRERPGRERSLLLEQATGIPASVWLFSSSAEIKAALAEMNN